MEIYYHSRFKAATSCWEFRMRQGRMEPRGSGASQVGQRPWPSSLEILCWFCLLSVLLVGPKRRRCCTAFFLPKSTGTIFRARNVLHRFYCLRQLCKWQRDAEVRGQRERRQSLIPWPALVIHDIHLPCGNRGTVALIPLVSRSLRLGWLDACMTWKLLRLSPVSHTRRTSSHGKCTVDQHAQNTDQV